MNFFTQREYPTGHLWLFVTLTHFLIFIPNTAHFLGINFAEDFIKEFINSSSSHVLDAELSLPAVDICFGLVAALPMVAAIPGAFLGRYIADRYGRKIAVFYCAAGVQLVGSLLTTLAVHVNNVLIYYLARAFFGIGFSILVTTLNVYVSESSPPALRGFIGNIATVVIGCDSTLVYVFSLPQLFGSEELWHYLYMATAPFSIVTMVMGYFMPESPKFDYIQMEKPEAAEKTIKRYYGSNKADTEEVLEEFEREKNQASARASVREIWQTPHLRCALIVAVLIGSTRVTSGVLLFVVFSKSIVVHQVGLDPDVADYCIVALAAAMVFASLAGAFFIDLYGRRPLFLGCSTAMLVLAVAFIGFSYISVHHVESMKYLALCCVFAILLIFQSAPNTLQFYFLTEIVPQTARAMVSTISLVVSLFIRILYFLTFPLMQDLLGPFAIVLFVVLPTVPTLMYLHRHMPETKNRSVDEVVAELMLKYSHDKGFDVACNDLKPLQSKESGLV